MMNLLCWEGYEADNILREFARQQNIQCSAQTLLSDADTAYALFQGEPGSKQWDILNINNPWCRDFLCRHDLICPLSGEQSGTTPKRWHTPINSTESLRAQYDSRSNSGNADYLCPRMPVVG